MGRIAITLLAAGLVAGCSSTKPYESGARKNIRIRTVTESGSVFSSVRAAVNVYSVDKACKTSYRGTIALDEPSIRTGIPVGGLSYLVFVFSSSSFFGNSSGRASYQTLLSPRPGYAYDIEVSYLDNMYDATVREINPRNKARREIERRDMGDCKAR